MAPSPLRIVSNATTTGATYNAAVSTSSIPSVGKKGASSHRKDALKKLVQRKKNRARKFNPELEREKLRIQLEIHHKHHDDVTAAKAKAESSTEELSPVSTRTPKARMPSERILGGRKEKMAPALGTGKWFGVPIGTINYSLNRGGFYQLRGIPSQGQNSLRVSNKYMGQCWWKAIDESKAPKWMRKAAIELARTEEAKREDTSIDMVGW